MKFLGTFIKCTKCKKWKTFSKFHTAKTKKSGYACRCKKCTKEDYQANKYKHNEQKKQFRKEHPERVKEWSQKTYAKHRAERLNKGKEFRQNNKELLRERAAKHYQKNSEQIKESASKWYYANRDNVRQRAKVYYQNNKDKWEYIPLSEVPEHKQQEIRQKRRGYIKKWRKENPDKFAAQGAKRRARKKCASGNLSSEEVKRLISLQDYKCLACGKKFIIRGTHNEWHINHFLEPTIDHIVKLGKNGSHSVENVQMLCRSCNAKKHEKAIDYRSNKLKKAIFKQYELF